MCKNKRKEEPVIATTKAIMQVGKPLKPLNYPCHICGIMGHKLMNCIRFGEMHNIFKDKGGKTEETKLVAKVKVAITLVNMVDVHVTV
jgi:hypothetical protein